MTSKGYPPDWDRRRKRVYRRDNYRCRNCGARGGPYGNAELHAHHGVPLSKGGSNDLSNLLTYCKECHHAIHGNGTHSSTSQTATSTETSTEPDYRISYPRTYFRYFGKVKDPSDIASPIATHTAIGGFIIGGMIPVVTGMPAGPGTVVFFAALTTLVVYQIAYKRALPDDDDPMVAFLDAVERFDEHRTAINRKLYWDRPVTYSEVATLEKRRAEVETLLDEISRPTPTTVKRFTETIPREIVTLRNEYPHFKED